MKAGMEIDRRDFGVEVQTYEAHTEEITNMLEGSKILEAEGSADTLGLTLEKPDGKTAFACLRAISTGGEPYLEKGVRYCERGALTELIDDGNAEAE